MKKLFATILSLSLMLAPMPAVANGVMLKQFVGLANGIVGSSVLMKCKMGSSQASVNIYMLGSLAYIMGEIVAAKQKAKDTGNQAEEVDKLKAGMTEGGDFQKKTIQAQIDSEKSNLRFIEKRKKFVTATMAIYTAATIMAVIEQWWEVPPPVGLGKTSQAACTAGDNSEKVWMMALGAAYSTLMTSGGKLSAGGVAMGLGTQAAMKLFMPKLAAATAGADASVTGLNSAMSRIIFFGAMTALVGLILKEVKESADETNNRIAQLELVKGQFDGADNALAEGGGTDDDTDGVGGERVGISSASNKQYALKELPKGKELAKHCLSNSSGAITFSEEGCKSPAKLLRPNLEGKLQVPALMMAINSAGDYTQALADGDLTRADAEAGSLASMSGNLASMKDTIMKKANDRLIAEGKQPLDINAEVKRQMETMGRALNKVEAGSGDFELADLNLGNSDATSETVASVDINTISSPAGVEIPSGTGLDFSDLNAEVESAANSNPGSLSENLSAYESTESDIAKDPGVSIFKQVSNRYFLNYTKIFEKKVAPSPMNNSPSAQ